MSTNAPAGLRRTLQRRHMEMIALGGVIGAGLFVGSGVLVKAAGPAAVLSFALTGALVVLVMRMLGEMAGAFPAIGGFYEYNRLARGELAGFLTGLLGTEYWFACIKVAAIVVFLCVGAAYMTGTWPGSQGGFANLTHHGGFLPNGIGPVPGPWRRRAFTSARNW